MTIDLNELLKKGTLKVVEVPEDFDWELYEDLDCVDGLGGCDSIILREQKCVLCSPNVEKMVKKLVKTTIKETSDE